MSKLISHPFVSLLTLTIMTTFKVNQTYKCRSICDYNCIWTYKVIKRTASTITLKDMDTKEVKTCRVNKKVSEWNNSETIYPTGHYSMCPTLTADKIF